MKTSKDPRHLSRVLALQTLFSQDFMPDSEREEFSIEQLVGIDEIEKYDADLYSKIIKGVREKESEIDEIITKHAPQWPKDQIKKVDLEILRISIFEGFIEKCTPPKVAIDEAIELGKLFGGNTSDKFVNGVLGALYDLNKDKNG